MDNKSRELIVRIPLHFTHKGKNYHGEVVGKVFPFNKYFTCRIPGENMLILEARPGDTTEKFSWVSVVGNDFSYLLPFIGRELEKFIC